jgi:predicted transcriptional regulator
MYDPRIVAKAHIMPEQPSRTATVPITAHLPREVRDRLKILAVKLGRTMNELMAEALDDLFAKNDQKTDDQP